MGIFKKDKLKIKGGNGWQNFLYLLACIVVVNVLSSQNYTRFDLTKEKRFTLSETSIQLAQQLEDDVYFDLYFEGDFPSDYKKLQSGIKDLLNEYRRLSGGKIEFVFDDILTGVSQDEKNNILRQLVRKDVRITRPELSADDAISDKFIIPGGMVTYNNREFPINFLVQKFGISLEERINLSIEQIEYEISKILRLCVAGEKKKLAFIAGHGELKPEEVSDIAGELSKLYDIERMSINIADTNCLKLFRREMLKDSAHADEVLITELIKQLNTYSGIIIAKPVYRFKEVEKFVLDQYVMNGGKIIWLVESLIAEMDSVAKYERIMTADYDLNLNDLLFKFGVRINPDLIQDKSCHGIPALRRGGGKPGFMPWIYYPLMESGSNHSIVRNLSPVWGRFVSSIDTTGREGVKKTVLLTSSKHSRIANNPVRISMDQIVLGLQKNEHLFKYPNNITAVLLEGSFTSSYEYREGYKNKTRIPYKNKVENNAMLFISDGDLIRNQLSGSGEVYPLGYDRFASDNFGRPVEFANKTFFLNCVDYLCDDANLMEIRSKKIDIRLLNKTKVKAEKLKWQLINLIIPALLLLIFGLVNAALRKRKWAR